MDKKWIEIVSFSIIALVSLIGLVLAAISLSKISSTYSTAQSAQKKVDDFQSHIDTQIAKSEQNMQTQIADSTQAFNVLTLPTNTVGQWMQSPNETTVFTTPIVNDPTAYIHTTITMLFTYNTQGRYDYIETSVRSLSDDSIVVTQGYKNNLPPSASYLHMTHTMSCDLLSSTIYYITVQIRNAAGDQISSWQEQGDCDMHITISFLGPTRQSSSFFLTVEDVDIDHLQDCTAITKQSGADVTCPSGAVLNGFHMQAFDNNLKFAYKCGASPVVGACTSKSTDSFPLKTCDDVKNLSVGCSTGEALGEFKLTNDSDQYRYNYQCCPITATSSPQCTTRTTDYTSMETNINLCHTPVTCAQNEYLSSFQYQPSSDGGQVRYSYTCCALPQ